MPSGIQNFPAKSDVDLSGGGTFKITPHEAHTRDKTPTNVAGFGERILLQNNIEDDKEPRLLVSWSLGHKDADVITVMEDGRSEVQRFVEVQSRRTVLPRITNFRGHSRR